MVGKTISHYEILDSLGAGGMGEVYRARDTRLGREVAIKVLPEELAADPQRLVRLEREAKLLAALNHPHIATIHAFEQSPECSFLVLELIKGQPLQRRLAGGALPESEALELGRQIAEALEAAHAEGIVHRDLKPANVIVTDDGRAKVLDFGIAKSLAVDAPAAETLGDTHLTAAGTLVGTPAYMSPEQLRGEPAGKQADVWAFGCLVYEMLTGRAAFGRETTADTLAAVVEQKPDERYLPPVHPRVRMLLDRCLDKNPRDRYHDIADARVDVQAALTGEADQTGAPAPEGGPASWPHMVGAALAGVAVTALIATAITGINPSADRRAERFDIALPDDHALSSNGWRQIAVSPDGSLIVYVADQRLYLRPIGEWEARPIPGTEGQPAGPFFAPDGRSVGYWDRDAEELRRVSIEGGTAVRLDAATNLLGASWAAGDTIVYGKLDGIWKISAARGVPEQLVAAQAGERMHGPQLLPDGRSVLFTLLKVRVGPGLWEGSEIVVQDLEDDERLTIVSGSDGRYLPTGHLVYALGNTLFAVPFDPDERRLLGAQVPIVEQVRPGAGFGGNTPTRNWDVSDDGMLAYLAGRAEARPTASRNLVIVDREGNARPVTEGRRDYWRPRLSPDGERVAVEVFDGRRARVWVVEVGTGEAWQLTSAGLEEAFPVWAPDGASVLYTALLGDDILGEVHRKAIDGRGAGRSLGVSGTPQAVSDNDVVSFLSGGLGAERRLGTFELDDPAATARIVLDNPSTLNMPAISPDGDYLAYNLDDEVWISPLPIREGAARRISEGGGAGPVWSRDSTQIYYRSAGFIAVQPNPFKPPPGTTLRGPLFEYEGRYRISGNAPAFDVFPDGERFIMVTLGDPTPSHPHLIRVVRNWFEELATQAPGGR